MQVEVHGDKKALAAAAAAAIADRASGAAMTLGLAGGSTPAGTYDELHAAGIDWDRIGLWLSDERWVAPDDPESNGRMVLEHLPVEAAPRLLRPRFSAYLDAHDSAAHYEAELRSLHDDQPPDLILLGMGTDGHTASLFPGTKALDADPYRWYVANHVPQLDAWRLTATPSLLRSAQTVLVLVSGGSKARVLAEVIDGPAGVYPIQLLRDAEGDVTFFCDREAASALSA